MQVVDKLMWFSMAVSDMPKAKAFYGDKLGLKVASDYRKDDHNWWDRLPSLKVGLLSPSPPLRKT